MVDRAAFTFAALDSALPHAAHLHTAMPIAMLTLAQVFATADGMQGVYRRAAGQAAMLGKLLLVQSLVMHKVQLAAPVGPRGGEHKRQFQQRSDGRGTRERRRAEGRRYDTIRGQWLMAVLIGRCTVVAACAATAWPALDGSPLRPGESVAWGPSRALPETRLLEPGMTAPFPQCPSTCDMHNIDAAPVEAHRLRLLPIRACQHEPRGDLCADDGRGGVQVHLRLLPVSRAPRR